ncbi:MAG TPA: hypothetical protein VI233_01780 [Puia sp.]
MKTTLRVASILTWINLLFWGFMVFFMLLGGAVGGPAILLMGVLFSSIPLSCYAGLQLHKSIRRPTHKLSSQTPVGIRFVGFVAIFLGIQVISSGISFLFSDRDALQAFKQIMSEQVSKSNGAVKFEPTYPMIHAMGGSFLFLGICVIVNAILNMRLLRWYYLVKQSDVS